MATLNRRLTAKLDGDFVVFLIGARINRWWKLHQHLWFLGTMPKMLKELEANPASGFLGYESVNTSSGRLGRSDGSDSPVSPSGDELRSGDASA